MTVQDAETPGRQDQQSGAGKQDADDVNRKFPFFTNETGGKRAYQQRRGDDAGEDENGYRQGQEGAYGSSDTIGLCLPATPEERRVHRNEGR
jgi:hypothetical protein